MLVIVNELLKMIFLTHETNSEMHLDIREILEWQVENSETNNLRKK